ncbi:uncharacterized protein NDAI_0A03810 [Naumovozyma dairenensis CBS 421]|uniref:SAC domain-containing protein n=1 Tax=Naumovozyma dairenensis (strain ATCC 10597 / BCRC 20456 / CBS 421 / NBRC 0211 / NRRL Y-12639) TaxID=1071378 RepID=G0W400_NAUDC|nr:hypothetical protein NDAI_0A03810 [Naumovozyma dairenensis CBS 421]CCD22538.1 hypothetical protein NDAI_0A03810 [Naumovozyma dairenensis CBS 421]
MNKQNIYVHYSSNQHHITIINSIGSRIIKYFFLSSKELLAQTEGNCSIELKRKTNMTAGPILILQTPDGLVFKPKNNNDIVLQLSNQDHVLRTISLEDFNKYINNSEVLPPIEVPILLGFIQLKLNKYVVVGTAVETVGYLNGNQLLKIKSFSLIKSAPAMDQVQNAEEMEFLNLLELQLNKSSLYFSYGYDLTNSLQRNEYTDKSSGSMWETVDDRFFWNHYMTSDLRSLNEVTKNNNIGKYFIQPVIYGYVKLINTVFQNKTSITIGLISRKSRFRAGTRYFRRGVDKDGHVSNFNETEQVLVVEDKSIFSFIQIRGSVPVYWAEINNLKYKPSLVLNEEENSSLDATRKHFSELKSICGENYLVNLVNCHGHELPVKEAYEKAVNLLDDSHLKYIYFDFHHECSKMRWDRVGILIDHLKNLGFTKGNDFYFHKDISNGSATGEVITEQHRVVRTNCMDCLDRTNVVQSIISQWVLQIQLEACGVVVGGGENVIMNWTEDKKLLRIFQNLWADNANSVSLSYSGTKALKTDFTRTGKRTYLGAFNDFINSASRYYQNNFTDGPRQDSYDLILGNFQPHQYDKLNPSLVSIFHDKRPLHIQLIPTLILAALTILIATIFFPKGDNFFATLNLCYFIVSVLIIIVGMRFLLINGIQYVNWPKLVNVGFLDDCKEEHTKEKKFGKFKYSPSKKFTKPNSTKTD